MTRTTDPRPDIIDKITTARKLAVVSFPIEPTPASRPRVTRWGTYYAKPYKDWMTQAAKAIKPGDLDLAPDAKVLVVIFAVCTKARTSKLRLPKGDVDNYAKGPMDVITKATGYWHDDKQVETLLSSKRFAMPGEQARSEVHIYQCD